MRSTVVLVGLLCAVGCKPAGLPGSSGGGGPAIAHADLASAGPTASGSEDPPASGGPSDLAMGGAPACPDFRCDSPDGAQTCSATDYCYSGAEDPRAYSGDPGVRYGCNALPAECGAAPTCACVLAHYRAGFCTCDDRCGLTLFCSLA